MSLTKTVGFFAGTTLAIGGVAFGADQTNYAAEIAALKAEIASMKNAQGGEWLTEQRASEIRSIVTDVLADAETRSSLQGSGATSGYDGGFSLSSADGNYSMKVNVLQQIRWTYNDRDTPAAGEDQTWGFENKRTRLTFSGNMVDSTWSYKIAYYFGYSNNVEGFGETSLAFVDANGNGTVEAGELGLGTAAGGLADAFVTKDFGNGFSLSVGQFKVPYSAESSLDAGNLQFNDYSTVSNNFANGYGQGVKFGWSSDMFRVAASYTNSIGQTNTSWGVGSPADEYALSARGEFKIAGDWNQFASGSAGGKDFGAVVGVGVDWSDSNDPAQGDTFGITVDGTVDFGAGNVSLAIFRDDNDGVAAGENPWGFTLGGGVFVTPNKDIEVVARYEYGNADIKGITDNRFSAMTLGANWYLAKNAAKLGVNFGYAFSDIGGTWGSQASGNNWLADGVDQDGQWMFQAQMSFSF